MVKEPHIGFVYNTQVTATASMVQELVENLGLKKTAWISTAEELAMKREQLQNTSIVVVAGGDGTILRTVRVTSTFEIPLVGINMGKVGFMAELNRDEALEKLPKYLDDKYHQSSNIRLEERMMLEANIISKTDDKPRITLHALNDVTIGTDNISRLVELEASVNDAHLTNYRADAVIVATVTGRTGYALAAGGPIVFPEADLMILQPVAAHTGLRDCLILSPDSTISLEISGESKAAISADGFMDSILEPGERISVKKSPNKAQFLRAKEPAFFYTALNMRLGLAYRSQRPAE